MKRTVRIRVSIVRIGAPAGTGAGSGVPAAGSRGIDRPGWKAGQWDRALSMPSNVSPLLLPGALPASRCEAWLRALGPPGGPSRPLSALDGLDAAEVLRAVAQSPLGAVIERDLGRRAVCDVDQSWVRHGRPPHGWHQDGALRFDFLAHAGRALPSDAALDMRVCWIALTPCGEEAPGLEWVDSSLDRLLRPAELTDESVGSRFAPDLLVHPCLQPGDALLFDGLLLHRTHLTSAMRRARASLELRFFPGGGVPPRIAGDRFTRLR